MTAVAAGAVGPWDSLGAVARCPSGTSIGMGPGPGEQMEKGRGGTMHTDRRRKQSRTCIPSQTGGGGCRTSTPTCTAAIPSPPTTTSPVHCCHPPPRHPTLRWWRAASGRHHLAQTSAVCFAACTGCVWGGFEFKKYKVSCSVHRARVWPRFKGEWCDLGDLVTCPGRARPCRAGTC